MSAVDGEPRTAGEVAIQEENDLWEELRVQRKRADRTYQEAARFGPSRTDLREFNVENERLVALELRWQNRRRALR